MHEAKIDPRATGAPLLAGIELGGTQCVCTLARGPDDIVAQATIPTTNSATTLAAVEAVLDGWATFAAIGIGSFGPIGVDRAAADYGHVRATPKPGWSGADVAGRISRRYAVPTGFDTDVTAAALAEGRWGAAQGLDSFAYITVGTGVGAGIIVGGRAVNGLGHAEAGHLRVRRVAGDDWPGSCPFHGDCVEGLASGSAIAARLGVPGGTLPPDHPVWPLVADAIAQLCHALVLIAVPQRILIGGGVPTAQDQLIPLIRENLRASLNGYVAEAALMRDDYVTPPALGALAGPLGSIALAADAFAGAAA